MVAAALSCAENTDPCAEPATGEPTLSFGHGSGREPFVEVPVSEGLLMVMGEQGLPMFDVLGMSASGVVPHPPGRSKLGWFLVATRAGEEIGKALGSRHRREGPRRTAEVVGLRVISDAPALTVWGEQVTLTGEIEGQCGRVARGSRTFEALRP